MSETLHSDIIARIGPPGDVQVFSMDEARAVLPVLMKITQHAACELSPLQNQLKRILPCDPRIKAVEIDYERKVRAWIGKVERLGMQARGVWWVDIDVQTGYLCWRYPEIRLEYFHGYDEKPSERKKISEIAHMLENDWLH